MPAEQTHSIALSELLSGFSDVPKALDCMIQGMSLDSRTIQANELFFAVQGEQAEGCRYISDAISKGAIAIVVDNTATLPLKEVTTPIIRIADLKQKVGILADRFYAHPSQRCVLIAVTGTNGKTTCTQLISKILDNSPDRCGQIGTLGIGFPDELATTGLTTPDVITVHRIIARFVADGATHVCMEVSSHALAQYRVSGVAFDIAVFTNLSRDHLDYHGTMEQYALEKSKLFNVDSLKYAIINADDKFGQQLIEQGKGNKNLQVVSYGTEHGDINATEIYTNKTGLTLTVQTPQGLANIRSKLFGLFNASNLLAVLSTLIVCDLSLDRIVDEISQLESVPGRVEKFSGDPNQPMVIVDYAHTPDALEKVLTALRQHTEGQLWCVFGCGGDRDQGKRAIMGTVAESLADQLIITNDNPRHESATKIIDDIQSGIKKTATVIEDRASAIAYAIDHAASRDMVLVAGKGHEDYQQIGDKKLPYSDRITVRQKLGMVT